MAGVLAMEWDEQYRGTLRKPKIGISWRDGAKNRLSNGTIDEKAELTLLVGNVV